MNMDLHFYWKLLLKRLPVMTALMLICVCIGVVLAIRMPTVYETSAQLFVEPPQVSGLSQDRANRAEKLELVEERLMTRSNLIDTAHRYGVFSGNPNITPDEIAQSMRGKTDIRRVAGRNRATLMTITFKDSSPEIVASVVNRYVTLILEENVRQDSRRTESNVAFFDQESKRLSEELDLQSQKIIAFKQENADALPEGQRYRLQRQVTLQERLTNQEKELANLRTQRERIVETYEATGRIQGGQRTQLSTVEKKLEALKSDLAVMLSIYKDTNPRVVMLKSRIEALEKVALEQASVAGGDGVDENLDPDEAMFQLTLTQIDGLVESLSEDIAKSNTELEELDRAIELSAANGVALEGLVRTYDNIRTEYRKILSSNNDAKLEERLVNSARGQRILVLEQPSVPNKPSSPNRPLVVMASVVAGLGLAAAYFALLELLNRTIRRPAEMTARLGITPLVTIPYMESKRDIRVRRGLQIAIFLAVLVLVPALLWAIDQYYLPLDLLMARIMDKIGLG